MAEPPRLLKQIGFWAAASILIGSVIGSGVFMKPASMAAQLGSPIWLTLVWVIAGLFSLFGVLIFAELGGMLPKTGGLYVYFQHMFGESFAFLYGWSALAVINTAAVAAIAFVCAQYANYFLDLPRFDQALEQSIAWHIPFIGDLYPLENAGVKSLAIGIVILLTYLNYRSVKAGSAFQVFSTFLKIAVITALVVGIFISGNGSVNHFIEAENPAKGWNLFTGIVVAMTGAFFAYDGWINISFIAGEIKQPQKNIPKSLFVGVLISIVIYVLVNQAYLYALPVEKIASSSLVASDAIASVWSGKSGAIIAALIVICTLGAINGNVLATSRLTYAMGKDRVFFPWTGKEHKKFQTPGNALWLHAIWTSVLILTGSFDMLADMMVFMTWVMYGLGAIGLFILRKKMPQLNRPYKVWGYPWVPIIFITFCGFYLFFTVWNDISNYLANRQPIINSLLGLLLTGIGIPLYFYFKAKNKTRPVPKVE